MAPEPCTICGIDAALKACAICKTTYYCSAACQKLDWPLHKLLCKKLTEFLKTRPPGNPILPAGPNDPISTSHHVGILMKADRFALELVWLESEFTVSEEEDGVFSDPWYDIHESRGKYIETAESMRDTRNGHDIEIWVDSFGAPFVGSPRAQLNKTMLQLQQGYSRDNGTTLNETCWSNHLLILRTVNVKNPYPSPYLNLARQQGKNKRALEEQDPLTSYLDATVADVRYALEILMDDMNVYDAGVTGDSNKFVVRSAREWIQGVRFMCPGEAKAHNCMSQPYQPVFLKRSYFYQMREPEHLDAQLLAFANRFCPAGKQHPKLIEVSPASKYMGLDLRVTRTKFYHDSCYKGNASKKEFCDGSPMVPVLMYIFDPSHESWGRATCDIRWDHAHSVFIIREDKKDLTVYQAEAFVEFLHNEIEGAMETVGDEESGTSFKQKKKFIERSLMSPKFEGFFDKYKAKQIVGGKIGWKDAKAPERNLILAGTRLEELAAAFVDDSECEIATYSTSEDEENEILTTETKQTRQKSLFVGSQTSSSDDDEI